MVVACCNIKKNKKKIIERLLKCVSLLELYKENSMCKNVKLSKTSKAKADSGQRLAKNPVKDNPKEIVGICCFFFSFFLLFHFYKKM